MPDYTLAIGLTLQGPILTHSTATGASGISSPFAINADGYRFLPRTLIKGRLRQSWAELHSATGTSFNPDVIDLLGERSDNLQTNSNSVDPIRGRLHFEDFVDVSNRIPNIRYRISIDEERGSVSRGAYQVLEAPYALNEQVVFSGHIHYRAADQSAADGIKRFVEIGLRWITSFGAQRTIGFGRLVRVSVSSPILSSQPAAQGTVTGVEKLGLSISPRSPFCLARRRIVRNLFESEPIIAGAAIKGCLASSWRTLLSISPNGAVTPNMDSTRLELCQHFEKVRITHAFPAYAPQATRPVTAPLSLVKVKPNDQLFDVALQGEPILIGNAQVAPEFAVDWKSFADVQQLFGWANPDRELRVRTEIDPVRRKAKEEQLFAYEMIVPRGVTWHCQLDLSAVPASDRAKVEAQIRDLLSYGLYGLGKTKARADVEIHELGTVPPTHASQPTPRDEVWIVTLQTPSLICDPARVYQSDLLAAYDAAWLRLSMQSLKLKHFYAQQSLSGGFYLHRRFQPGKEYKPWLLTEAGSVFILEAMPGKQTQAQECIDEWLEHGMPLPEWAITSYGDHWSTCPFVRECGYGEIAVNLDIHWSKQPRQGECHVL